MSIPALHIRINWGRCRRSAIWTHVILATGTIPSSWTTSFALMADIATERVSHIAHSTVRPSQRMSILAFHVWIEGWSLNWTRAAIGANIILAARAIPSSRTAWL
jgi:hypothetical protein